MPLAPLTTLGVGGSARFFAEATDRDHLRSALEWAERQGLPVFLLGGGSNVVVHDDGWDGLVVRVAMQDVEAEEGGDGVVVRAAAGETWDRFVERSVGRGWSGVECLSGIPGSVGATPIQNVGAYGQQVSDVISEVEVLDLETRRVRWLGHAECEFGYRTSALKRGEVPPFAVLSVVFRLGRDDVAVPRYPDLDYLATRSDRPSLADVRQAVIGVRRRKGMVVDIDDPESRSVGSFFVNPILSTTAYAEFLERAHRGPSRHLEIPAYPTDQGTKVPAAWLIEQAGFSRGYSQGPVGLSAKHALAIVNRGRGRARDVVDLATEICEAVRERFGVSLEREARLIGFEEESA